MSQRLQISRCPSSWLEGHGERMWLAALVEAMEEAARRPEACDAPQLAALRAQLALPAQPRFASPFSLRN